MDNLTPQEQLRIRDMLAYTLLRGVDQAGQPQYGGTRKCVTVLDGRTAVMAAHCLPERASRGLRFDVHTRSDGVKVVDLVEIWRDDDFAVLELADTHPPQTNFTVNPLSHVHAVVGQRIVILGYPDLWERAIPQPTEPSEIFGSISTITMDRGRTLVLATPGSSPGYSGGSVSTLYPPQLVGICLKGTATPKTFQTNSFLSQALLYAGQINNCRILPVQTIMDKLEGYRRGRDQSKKSVEMRVEVDVREPKRLRPDESQRLQTSGQSPFQAPSTSTAADNYFQAMQLLQSMLLEEENQICAECGGQQQQWTAWNLGVFLCQRCALLHYKLRISQIKALDDRWTEEEINSMLTMGNANAQSIYEAGLSPQFQRPQSDRGLEKFLYAKYIDKLFFVPQTPVVEEPVAASPTASTGSRPTSAEPTTGLLLQIVDDEEMGSSPVHKPSTTASAPTIPPPEAPSLRTSGRRRLKASMSETDLILFSPDVDSTAAPWSGDVEEMLAAISIDDMVLIAPETQEKLRVKRKS